MLDKDTAKILEKNVIERINKMYPSDGDPKLVNLVARIATQAAIITLQEYEKLKPKTDQHF